MLIRFRHTALHLVLWLRRERGDALRQDARIFGHRIELPAQAPALIVREGLKNRVCFDESFQFVELFIQILLFVHDSLLVRLHCGVSPWWASKMPVHSPTNRALACFVRERARDLKVMIDAATGEILYLRWLQHLVGLSVCV
jgi:hypothetical protein